LRRLLLALAVLLLLPEPAPAEADSLEELRHLVAAHPRDPDLAWLRANALQEEGRTDEAVAALQSFLERWPAHRPEARRVLGQLLYEAGQHEQALDALEAHALENPMDGLTHFYRGLALRALQRHRGAERALQVAARLSPELEAEGLLLAGFSHLELGERVRSSMLFRRVVELAPESETARHARLLLGGRQRASIAGRKRLTLFADGGTEYDSNVTLEGDLAPGGGSDRNDARVVWGAGLSYRAYQSESASATVGYRYSGSAHQDLEAYDLQSHLIFASGQVSPWERTTLRLDAFATDGHLNGDRYARTWALRPTLLYTFGPRAGVSRLYLEAEKIRYHDEPLLESLSRNGTNYALTLEHYAPLWGRRDAWGSAGVTLSKANNPSSRTDDLLGFDDAFSHRAARGTLRLNFPVGWKLTTDASASVALRRYANPNVLDGLFEQVFLDQAERRHDSVVEGTISVSRPLTEHTRVELRWRGTLQRSNVDLYSYNRNIVGLYLKTQTF
jgi:tetratricopeptide (TPR) repeat protein